MEATNLAHNVVWTRHCPPFNQGNIGSCTGNSAAGALMTTPFWERGQQVYTEKTAVEFYSEASQISSPGDYYPPNDVGSTGPAVAQALEDDGLISSYSHATDLETALSGMVDAPGIFGISWFTSFDTPLSTGECPLTRGATVRGGHEVQSYAVNVSMERVWFVNSWGTTWGGLGNGAFWFSYNTLTKLFEEQGDATFFVPVSPNKGDDYSLNDDSLL